MAWREVVKLGCSLASDSTDLVAAVYQRDPTTGLECLAEASQGDPTLANQILDYFKQKIDQPQTDDTERLNNTLRQRVARRVRKTLWFSKKLENHIGAIWLFIHGYNRGIRAKLAKQGDPIFSSGLH